jgi:cytidine deaminase
MNTELFQFEYEVYDSPSALNDPDEKLFNAAGKAAGDAYAPYSKFNVGAAARLENGEIVTGGNQENASFPAGLCAEGVVMAAAAARFPNVPVNAIAITYRSDIVASDHPISPCGICRQSMQEQRSRTGKAIRLIMGGATGKVIAVNDASDLLPLAFKF